MGIQNQELVVIYRTSDKGRPKLKLHNTRYPFLDNLLTVFKNVPIICIADNVDNNSFSKLESYNFQQLIRTSLGNSMSFYYAVEHYIQNLSYFKYVYFLEDDYIHLPSSMDILLEGLRVFDYVTLYDHPDKYNTNSKSKKRSFSCSSANEIILTHNSHWRKATSTTMTFETNCITIKKDILFFRLFSKGLPIGKFIYPRWFWDRGLPRDYALWRALLFSKKRTLVSSLPGQSTHGEIEFLSPLWKQ
jgi:hypothetical protein